MKRIAVIFAIVMAVCSCTREHRIKLPDDYTNVFTRNGRLDGFSPDPSKNKFILYLSPGCTRACLAELWTSNADSIFTASPDWQFIIYYKGALADTLKMIEVLDQCRISAPVVFNEEDQFLEINGIDRRTLEISYFIDTKNRIKGPWLVGDGSFEKQFNSIKKLVE